MPTGYTALLHDDPNATFADFALRCARNCGALIAMRDEPLDAPIAEFEPAPYYADAVARDEAEVARLEAMDEAEALAFGRRTISEHAGRYERTASEKRALQRRFRAMREEAEAWAPPTDDHAGLKSFMLEQLALDARHEDAGWYEERAREWRYRRPRQVYDDALAAARQSLAKSVDGLVAESERVAERNRWVAELRASLAA